jgi:hypothetical protein
VKAFWGVVFKFSDLGARWVIVVSFTLQLLYLYGRIHKMLTGVRRLAEPL